MKHRLITRISQKIVRAKGYVEPNGRAESGYPTKSLMLGGSAW